jgi:hypothetical protein
LTTQDVQVTVSPAAAPAADTAGCASAPPDVPPRPAATAASAADCCKNSRRGIEWPPDRLDMPNLHQEKNGVMSGDFARFYRA